MVDFRILLSLSVIILAIIINFILKNYINHKIQRYIPKTAKNFPINKLLNSTLIIVLILALISIWGVKIQNLWIYITSIVTLIAIGFFAVWSILSNVVAGIILLSTQRFRNGDEIIVYPEKIKGTIVNITLFFIILKDKQGYTVHIPNNMLFQRFSKKKGKGKNK